MKLKIASLSLVISALASSAFAKDSDWIIRLRGIHVQTDTTSKVETVGGHVKTTSDQVPELDFTRFFTPNIAAELILATTTHDVTLEGSSAKPKGNLGSVKLLPPTLTLQYHANPTGTFRPYAGAGLNYTFFYNAKAADVADEIKYKDKLGYALQAGFDYMIDDKVGINLDVKKIYLKTDAIVNNSLTAKVRLDPWIVGAGISYHF